MSRSPFSAHRARPRTDSRCPWRGYYPDHASAADAATALGSRVESRCRRCRGYHLTLKDTSR